MKKVMLAVFASVTLLAAGAASADKTYVVDSNGNPIMNGDKCVVAAGAGTAFEQCNNNVASSTEKTKAAPAQAYDKTYIADSYGKPVMNGDQCIVAAGNNGTYFEECGGGKMAKQMPEKPAPQPRVITKVIVDCSKCK